MTTNITDNSSESTAHHAQPSSDDTEHQQTSAPKEATVVVRGEVQGKNAESTNGEGKKKQNAPSPPLNDVNVKLRDRLPCMNDDADTGVQKDHIVTRDGKPDLSFAGTLLASAAPSSAPKGDWQEYRIYETTAGKHVFSKVGRNVNAEQEDTHEAEVFDPSPSSMPSKLLKSAHDLTHSRPATWADAAADFFGYDPLAKDLYRKLGGQFEERIG